MPGYFAGAQHFGLFNFEISRLIAIIPADKRLVDHYLGMRQSDPAPLFAAGKKERSHACTHTDADSTDRAFDIVHCVVYRHARADASAGGIDIKRYFLFRILTFEEQKLCHHERGNGVVYLLAYEYYPVVKQARKNIVGAFSARRLFDDHR